MKTFLLLTTAFSLTTLAVRADDNTLLRKEEDEAGIFSFTLENDYFAGHDDGYTNGVRFAWLSSESDVPIWLEDTANLLPFFADEGHKRYGFAFGQSMFAPADLENPNLIEDDRPYAGWLYGTAGVISDTGTTLDNFQLTIGVVGPASLAEHTQDFVHELVNTRDPAGWDNQLENEPGVILTYQRKWRGLYQLSPYGLGVDVTPHVGANLGNVYTDASTGAIFRIGYDLPADYGPPLIYPSLTGSDFFVPTKEAGWYLFAGVDGRAVGRNIFLDGNTFRDSYSVDKEFFVGGLQAGIAFTYEDVRIAYTQVWRTKEFESQEDSDEYGAITVSYRF